MNHAEMQFLTTEFPFKKQYGNFIGGKWVQPVGGEYFDNVSPITGEPFTSIPRSREADIELALDAAHGRKTAWGKTSPTDRANILNKHRRPHRSEPAACSRWPKRIDNGKPIRETMAADIPLADRSFPLFRGLRARAGRLASRRSTTTPWPITFTSRSAWSGRSFRGISRS